MKFRMVMCGIVAAGFLLASSGCYEWNHRGDYSGYDRVGSSYDRNDRRWDGGGPYHNRETNNSFVYLTGEVETSDQKSRVGSVASQVKGVKQVVNNLQVIKR